jgi:hypothetical protein
MNPGTGAHFAAVFSRFGAVRAVSWRSQYCFKEFSVMAAFKVILEFGHPRGGWSEVYYTDAPTLESAALFTNVQNLITFRGALVDLPAQITFARVSSETLTGNAILYAVGDEGTFNYTPFPDTVGACDYPAMRYLNRYRSAGTGLSRPLYMGGIPDSIWATQPDEVGVRTAWINVYNGIFNPEMTSGRWYIKYRPNRGIVPQTVITNMTPVFAGGPTTIAQDDALAVAVGNRVTFYHLGGICGFAHTQRVSKINTVAKTFEVPGHLPAGYVFAGGPTYIKLTPQYTAITNGYLERVVSKKVGRVFGSPRGRRSVCRA